MSVEVRDGTVPGSRQRLVTVWVGGGIRLVFGGSPDHLVRITARKGNSGVGGELWAMSHGDARELGHALIALADAAEKS